MCTCPSLQLSSLASIMSLLNYPNSNMKPNVNLNVRKRQKLILASHTYMYCENQVATCSTDHMQCSTHKQALMCECVHKLHCATLL